MRPLRLVWLAVFFVVVAWASACGSTEEKGESVGTGELVYSSTEVDFGEAAPRVWVIEPQDGADITSPFVVKMGHEGLILQGTRQGHRERYGHLHLLIDVPIPPEGEVIATDEQHLHYHNQQDEAVLNLSPGQHTISLVFGTTGSRPWDPPIENTISVNVTGQQRIFIIEPSDTDIREFPFTVKAGSEGLDLSKGHFVVVMAAYAFPKEGQPVPVDEDHFHFETGATELEMDYKVGGHKMTLLFVDENNMMLPGPTLSDEMNVAIGKPVKLEKMDVHVGGG